MSEPYLRLRLKTSSYSFLWLRYVAGFDQRYHCAKCLQGKWSRLIRWGYPGFQGHQAGFETMGRLDECQHIPVAYLCGVSKRGYQDNLHVPMLADQNAEPFVLENDNLWLMVSGMKRLDILPVPRAVEEGVPAAWHSCRNWQFGWWQFPAARRDLRLVPGAQASQPSKPKKVIQPHPTLPGLAEDGDFLF